MVSNKLGNVLWLFSSKVEPKSYLLTSWVEHECIILISALGKPKLELKDAFLQFCHHIFQITDSTSKISSRIVNCVNIHTNIDLRIEYFPK